MPSVAQNVLKIIYFKMIHLIQNSNLEESEVLGTVHEAVGLQNPIEIKNLPGIK
jgi:hypothetical protein